MTSRMSTTACRTFSGLRLKKSATPGVGLRPLALRSAMISSIHSGRCRALSSSTVGFAPPLDGGTPPPEGASDFALLSRSAPGAIGRGAAARGAPSTTRATASRGRSATSIVRKWTKRVVGFEGNANQKQRR